MTISQLKKDYELECLQRVINSGKKLRGKTKQIVKMLDGEDIYREDNERPDFVRLLPAKSKKQKDLIIGIEHFRVDQLSIKKKDGNIASTGIVFPKEIGVVYDRWQKSVKEEDTIPEKAIEDTMNAISNQVLRVKQSNYHTFLESFKHSLNKHLKNVEAYKKNLSKITEEKTNLVFLIEVHTEFTNLYLSNKKGTKKNVSGFMPLFRDVVDLLESIDKKVLDYIVLCLGGTVHDENVDILAFHTGNIKKQCERQHIPIYEYAGMDCLLTDFQFMDKDIQSESPFSINDDKIDMEFEYSQKTISNEQKLDLLFFAIARAYYAKKNNLNYVTTNGVLYYVDVFGDAIIDWEKPEGETESWKIRPIQYQIDPQIISERTKEFEERWELDEDVSYLS